MFQIDELRERLEPIPQSVERTAIAQDPSVAFGGRILTAPMRIPAERLEPGPRGARLHVVDYEGGANRLAPAVELEPAAALSPDHRDQFDKAPDDVLLTDAGFRAQNVYVLAARTLAAFEAALGRRLPWAFGGHQLFLVPRAFPEANAYYAPEDGAIYFGYIVRSDGSVVHASLSHDIIAHETTHAVLDGLRPRFAEPGLPDQPAFHEALGDIVALLSVFSVQGVVERLLGPADASGRVPTQRLSREALERSALFSLAEELGSVVTGERGSALRRSIDLPTGPGWREDRKYEEAHRRGEVLVAAVMRALGRMWRDRLGPLIGPRGADRARTAEEGAKAAGHLLHMFIRGIDYMPPLELEFEDVLDAVLKADEVVVPDDEHRYRVAVREAFAEFGILPPQGRIIDLSQRPAPTYERMNFEALRSDRDEIFRFLWENAEVFDINRTFRLRVEAVRPSVRVGPDGFIVGEVVADYVQSLELSGRELQQRGVTVPPNIAPATQVQVWGGGVVVFDQFGRAKYHQTKPLEDWLRQERRLEYLARRALRDSRGRFGFTITVPRGQRFAALHVGDRRAGEDW
jgi:hypothetical protein